MSVKPVTKIPTFEPTRDQRKWIEEKSKREKSSFASILRGLMQEAMEKESNSNARN